SAAGRPTGSCIWVTGRRGEALDRWTRRCLRSCRLTSARRRLRGSIISARADTRAASSAESIQPALDPCKPLIEAIHPSVEHRSLFGQVRDIVPYPGDAAFYGGYATGQTLHALAQQTDIFPDGAQMRQDKAIRSLCHLASASRNYGRLAPPVTISQVGSP